MDGNTPIWVARAFLNAFRLKLDASPATVKVAVMAATYNSPGRNGGGGRGGGRGGDEGGVGGDGGDGRGGGGGGGATLAIVGGVTTASTAIETPVTLASMAVALLGLLVALAIADCTKAAVAVGVRMRTPTMTLPGDMVSSTADGSTPARAAVALLI